MQAPGIAGNSWRCEQGRGARARSGLDLDGDGARRKGPSGVPRSSLPWPAVFDIDGCGAHGRRGDGAPSGARRISNGSLEGRPRERGVRNLVIPVSHAGERPQRPDRRHEITRSSLVTKDGKILHRGTLIAMGED